MMPCWPQTVVVMDLETNGFQDDRSLSTQVVAVIKAMGLGLLTYDRGLNPSDQVARREGLPSCDDLRELDAQSESAPLIRRYLDRAAFKAAQEGRVVVLGSTNLETITALMEWAVEGRGLRWRWRRSQRFDQVARHHDVVAADLAGDLLGGLCCLGRAIARAFGDAGPAMLLSFWVWIKSLLARFVPPRNLIVVDGSNVLFWCENTPQIATLIEVLRRLEVRGFLPGVVFDANAGPFWLRGKFQDEASFAALLDLPQDRVRVVDKSTPADPVVLETARKYGVQVVSNDRFRDWGRPLPRGE